MRLPGKIACLLAALPLAAFVCIQTLPSRWFGETPAKRLFEEEKALHAEVLSRGGLEAVWTFDGPALRGWYASQEELPRNARPLAGPSWAGATSVPGRFGDARRFSGREDCHYWTGYGWRDHGQSFTVALWVKAAPFPVRQDLLATADAGLWGFRLDGDTLCFDIPLEEGGHWTLSAPFNRRGVWTHVAFASDMEAGESRLWVDGERVATGPWKEVLRRKIPFCFGVASWRKTRDPFRGELDETAVWNRALDDAEIRQVATSGKSLEQLYGSHRLRRAVRRERFSLRARAVLDRLRVKNWPRPAWGVPRPPALSLSLSDSAWRHLSRAHARARASCCLTGGIAKPVEAVLSFGGTTLRCEVGLFGAPTYYPDSARPSYSIWPAAGEKALPDGSPRWVLSPPESCGWTELLAASRVADLTGLPVAAPCSLVRLRSNGLDRGVYLLRNFEKSGAVAGLETPCNRYLPPERTTGCEREWVEPAVPSRTVAAAVRTFLSPEEKSRLDDELERTARALAEDVWSPVPRTERRREIRNHLGMFHALPPGPAPAEDALLDETLLAGGNASPWRVVSDLPFPAVSGKIPPGAALSFRSLAPEWIDDAGRVQARPDRFPAAVPVEARYRDPSGAEKTALLKFRIMPGTFPLPAVFVWAGVPAAKLKREDAVVEFYAAGPVSNAPAWTLSASASTRGGFQFRGNSSFVAPGPRRIFGIKLDRPHGLFPGNPTRVLQMINNGTDPLKIANPMAFDLFREFPVPGGPPRAAPRVFHAELFMNGRYAGFQEFAERPDEDLPGVGDPVFHRLATISPRIPPIKPTRPTPREGDFSGPLEQAEALFAEPFSPSWPARVETLLDLDNFIDFQLLSNLFGNINGDPKHFLFDDIAAFDRSRGKFFYVPWDFDMTLRSSDSWLENDSDRRLWKDFPGYRERMAARWRELRAGCLAPERLRRQAESRLEAIAPALWTDWLFWNSPEDGNPDQWIPDMFAKKLHLLENRASSLDARFAAPAPAPPP